MPNTIEYAKDNAGAHSERGYYSSSGLNNVSRYTCNNKIGNGTNEPEEVSIEQARKAYTALYTTYTTNSDKTATVNSIPEEDLNCSSTTVNGIRAANCPHKVIIGGTNTNVLAYTAGATPTGNRVTVKDLKFYLDDCGARIRDYDNKHISDGSASYATVKNNSINFRDVSYNSLLKTRSDLDNKMNEILGNNKNSILYEKQSELDASVYSTLLWTVMVTSLLYYVFTKI